MANMVYFFKEMYPGSYDFSFYVGVFDKDKTIYDEGLDYLAQVFSFDMEHGHIVAFSETIDVIDGSELDELKTITESEYAKWVALVSEIREKVDALLKTQKT